MPVVRLTRKVVDALGTRERSYIAYDETLKGFGVRVSPFGVKTWIVEYRPHGGGAKVAKKRLSLGSTEVLTPDEARNDARKTLAEVVRGGDPAGERARKRETPTIAAVVKRFLDEEVTPKRKPRTAALYRDYLDRLVVPELGATRIDALTRNDIARLHRKIGARAQVTANRVIAVLSSLYGFAAEAGIISEGFNPTRGIEPFRETPRERYLSTEELQRLGAAIREAETDGIPWDPDPTKKVKHAPKAENRRTRISPHAAAAIRLLLFTGARLREILHLRWEHVDFERDMLLLPDSKTGRKPIILNAPALAVLNGLPRVGAYVIAGEGPERPRADLKKPWALISRRAGLEGVRIHDLRHSFASFGAGGGVGLQVIGKLLGHSQASTTQRYAHLADDPLRRASNAIAAPIAAALDGKPSAEVTNPHSTKH